MSSHHARIERSSRKNLTQVEVHITVTESSEGRSSWSGEFLAETVAGILPDERLTVTLETGQTGTARVRETHFDSRAPATTRVCITGIGPLV